MADPKVLLELTGPSASRLTPLERACHLSAGLRGQTIRLRGSAAAVALAERALTEMMDVIYGGRRRCATPTSRPPCDCSQSSRA